MRNLSNLKTNPGATTAKKRVGRGIGSGTGKTAAKGHKGQKARKGGGVAPGFEGGQTPLYRRLPKHGFTNATFKTKFTVVNLEQLNGFEENSVVSAETLCKAGLVKSSKEKIKVLGRGKLEKKLTFKVAKLSQSAAEMIKGMGGTVEGV